MEAQMTVHWVQILVGAVTIVLTFSGIFIWVVRRSKLVATETHVDESVAPLVERLDEADADISENQNELEEMRGLIEGGSSQWERGVLDFLEENIQRTEDIQQDLNEIRSAIERMKGDRSE